MKFYSLDGIINGHPIKGHLYRSRRDAEKALEGILYRDDLQVTEDRFPEKHTEEFVCNQYTRFFVRRVILG